MMNKLILLFSLPLLLLSCKNESSEVKEAPLELNTHKERISYVLGAMNARTIIGTQDPNIKRLDMNLIAEGFGENLKDEQPLDCEATIKKLFGPNLQDFDSVYAKEGSKCLGKMTGYAFYRDILKMNGIREIDLKIAKIGFRHGLLQKDTIISEAEKQTMIQNFIKDLNVKNGTKMMANAKKIKGAKVYENGIVMQTLKEGSGAFPGATDDVKVEYILTSATGDTVQSSYEMKKKSGSKDAVALKLNGGVIPGWSYIVPKMRKGGVYRVYVPWDLAYGEQMGRESLCFLIELVDFAKEGTFVKPQPNNMAQGRQGF